MPAGETIDMDIWLNDVPESMITAGFYVSYDTALIDITSIIPWDTNNGGLWEPAEPFSPEPGVWIVSLLNFSCVEPDGDGDILLARVTLQCQDVGDADVTIETIPDFDTAVGCSGGTAYDPEIVPNVVTIIQTAATACTIPDNCDDFNLCTTNECIAEECVYTPVVCDDPDLCTISSCDPGTGNCVIVPVDCDDGDLCTTDSCNPATGCFNVSIICDDGNPCTDDICDLLGNCIFNVVVDGTSCDDGVFCNGVDTCIGGECQLGIIPCTDDLLFCNGIESCDEVNDECIHSPEPCLPDGQCDEMIDTCWYCEITANPSSVTVPTLGTRQFSASTSGNCPVSEPDPSCFAWEVSIQESTGSNISSTGSYTAGGYEGTDVIQVSDTCNLNISATATAIVIPDTDEDGIRNEEDNCPEHPNGPYLGTCIRITGGFFTGFGVPCIDSTDCASDELCDTAQLNFDETGVGDACECRGNFDGDSDIDGKDAFVFKVGFGRSEFFNPCPSNQ